MQERMCLYSIGRVEHVALYYDKARLLVCLSIFCGNHKTLPNKL